MESFGAEDSGSTQTTEVSKKETRQKDENYTHMCNGRNLAWTLGGLIMHVEMANAASILVKNIQTHPGNI